MTSQHLAVVTLHDAAPAFSKRIFEFTDAFENLGINFNVATVPFFHSHRRPFQVPRIRR